MTFIERITALTEEKGIKEKQVLADCGLNKNQFGLWRQGRTPNAASQKVLADYFGVSVPYLMGETDERGQKKSPAQMDGAGKAKKNLLSAVAELSEDECKNVLALIDAAKKL